MNGKLSKDQQTGRLDSNLGQQCPTMTENPAARNWEKEEPNRAARQLRCIFVTPLEDEDDENTMRYVTQHQITLRLLLGRATPAALRGRQPTAAYLTYLLEQPLVSKQQRKYSEKIRPEDVHISVSHFGLVHAPNPMTKAMKMPDAGAAMEKVWRKR